MHHHTQPIQVTEIPARKVAAQLIGNGLYTTPEEVKTIALNLDSPEVLSNWNSHALTTIRSALDGYNVEWLTADYFAEVR